MDSTQYLAFIPLLIYGLGLSTLMTEWKRIFDPKEIFLPYSLFTLVLTELAVYNVFIYIRLIPEFQGQSYLSYLSYLVSPFLFFMATHVFTPEAGDNTKAYFINRMPLFFSLIALMVASHFIYQLEESKYANIMRLVMIMLLLIVGFSRKIWLTYIVVLLWALSFIIRGSIISG